MRRIFIVGAALLLAGGVPAAAQAPQPGEAEIETSRAAVAEADVDRIYDDPDYARELLAHLDTLDAATGDSRARLAMDSLRLTALSVLERHDEIRTVVDRVLSRRPADPAIYRAAWWAALSIPDLPRAVAVAETASRHVRGIGWGEVREFMGSQVPGYVLIQLERDGDDALRLRFAESLFRIGWPGGGDLERTNDLRRILVDYRIEQGDHGAAADLAAGLTDPASLLSLILLRRYDALFATDEERLARLRTAISEYDRLTLQALGTEPTVGAAFDRARFLRRLGRERDALTLLEPFIRDVAGLVGADYRGIWVVNEAAYALLSLDRGDEAVELMERLVRIPLEANGDLIGPYINQSIILLEADRPAEALAYATRLEREFAGFASDYGKRLIDSSIVCALAALGRASEAGPILERLRAAREDQPSPLTRAELCLGNVDEAEAAVISRLEGEHPETIVLAFQDYLLESDAGPGPDRDDDRLMSLRDRPAVRQALERVGRVLGLPLARLALGGT